MSDLLHFIRTFRTYFVHAALFSFFINLTMLVPSIFMIQVFDRVLMSRSNETLTMMTLAAAGVMLMMPLLDHLRGLLLLGAGQALDRMLGERVIGGLIQHAMRVERGEYVHGMRDVAVLRNFLSGNSIVALFDIPWGVFFVILIFLFHPMLGAIALVSVLVLFMLAWANERLNRAPLEQVQVASRRSSQYLDQGLRNADVINGMGMNASFVDRWQRLNEPVLISQAETGRRMGIINSSSKFLRQLVQIVMMAAGAYLVIKDNMTSGVMLASTIILGRALAPVEMLLSNWSNLVQARAAFARIGKYFEPVKTTAPATRLPIPEGRLSAERLTLAGRTPDRPIIRHVAFELAPGESLGIIGPSASGKSSLARLLVGAWAPTTGAVRLDGAEVSRVDKSQLGPYLGYLPQDVELFPGTVSENIARMGEVDSAAVVEAARYARVHDMILRLPNGYDTVIGEGGVILSGGQMQRIGLARAFYGKPRLVVLDEPNANLDSDGERDLMEIIRDLHRDKVTFVLVTHKPSLIGGIDKVLVMREGQMELCGPRQEVLQRLKPQTAAMGGPAPGAAQEAA